MKRRLVCLSFVSGLTVMTAEVAASRLIAPYFGSSTPVWALLISFVLGGMALGSYLGGRAADRWVRLTPLLQALCFGASGLALLPAMARLLWTPGSSWVLERPGLGLVTVIVFALLALPPVVLLGAVGPYLLRVGTQQTDVTGAIAGELSAAATVGSIAGTLLAAFVTLPLLGTARTVAGCGLWLAIAAGAPLGWRRLALAVLVPAAVLAMGDRLQPSHARAIEVRESPYALIQVLEGAGGARTLVFDEAFAFQSVYRPGQAVTETVFAELGLAPAMSRASVAPRVLLLGLGAGTMARSILQSYPAAQIVGVELDPVVLALARSHFALPSQVETHVADARVFLRHDSRRYDAILVDCFRTPYVPFHLTTVEFYEELREHLESGGVVAANAGRYRDERSVVTAIAGTLAGVFPEVLSADARNRTNTLLFAGERGLAERLVAALPELAPPALRSAERLAQALQPVSVGQPLLDDRAPVEFLADMILLRSLAKTGVRL